MEFYKNYSTETLEAEINGIHYIEQWESVKGYERFYDVSSFGRFYSIRDKKIMRQYMNEKGYLNIGFRSSNAPKKYKSHRIVAIVFNPNPENKPQVNHDDFDKTNNFYKNLLWATGKENTNHAQAGGKIPIKKIVPNPVIELGRIKRHKTIIDIETNMVYDSVYHLVDQIGGSVKELRKKLSGERPNKTPYRYTGEYFSVRSKEHEIAYIRFSELRKRIFG